MIPVKNYSYLYRDETTNAILNNDDINYQNYIKTKEKLLEDQKKIHEIENELKEIKKMLLVIIENK